MPLSSLNLQTNVGSINAQRNLARNERTLNRSMARLSSGLRITQAADDAAGLAISEKLRAATRGLSQAQRNANDSISMLQTAEGALSEVSDLLIRMRELSVQSANGTLGTTERSALNTEFVALRQEIDRISETTEFAGLKLLNGAQSGGVTFQVGIGSTSADRITVSILAAHTSGLNASLNLDSINNAAGALSALGHIDSALATLNQRRGEYGAKQNRLYSTINNLSAMHETLSAANSRIRDADVAAESASYAQTQILMQAGVAVLSQANQLPAMALNLIGG
jgi:flagellin